LAENGKLEIKDQKLSSKDVYQILVFLEGNPEIIKTIHFENLDMSY